MIKCPKCNKDFEDLVVTGNMRINPVSKKEEYVTNHYVNCPEHGIAIIKNCKCGGLCATNKRHQDSPYHYCKDCGEEMSCNQAHEGENHTCEVN